MGLIERVLRGALVVTAAGGALLWITLVLGALDHPYSLDYGEPVVELATRSYMESGQLYRPIGSFPLTLLPYNPLYPQSVALLAGEPERVLAAGRTLSVLATIALCLLVYHWARRIGAPRDLATGAALMLLTDPLILRWSMLLKSDLCALALEWGGLALLLGSIADPGGQRRLLRRGAGTALLIGAFFTKQTYVLAVPVFALVLVRGEGVAAALRWCLWYAGAVIGGILGLQALTQGAYGQNAYEANLLRYHARLAAGHAWAYLERHAIAVAAASLSLIAVSVHQKARQESVLRVLILYLGLACIWGALAGKVGAAENYFLQLTPALYVLVLAALRTGLPRLLVHLLLVLCALSNTLGATAAYSALSRDLSEQRRDLAPLIEALRRTHGEVLSEDLSLLLRAGKSVHYSPFEYTQLARSGRWDERSFIERVHRGDFELLLFQTNVFAVEESQRYSREFIAAVRRTYRPMGVVAGQIVCVRKAAGEAR